MKPKPKIESPKQPKHILTSVLEQAETMAKKRKANVEEQAVPAKKFPVTTWIAVIALLVSCGSIFLSVKAYNLNRLISLPYLTTTAELLEPITAGKPIVFKAIIEN